MSTAACGRCGRARCSVRALDLEASSPSIARGVFATGDDVDVLLSEGLLEGTGLVHADDRTTGRLGRVAI